MSEIGKRQDRIEQIALTAVPARQHEIAPPVKAGGGPAGGSAQINAGALIAFGKNTSRQNVADASNSVLFAQLAANAAADRFADIPAWSNKYASVLETVGWNVQRHSTSPLTRSPLPVHWVDVVTQALLTATGATLAATAMKAAARLSTGSQAVQIWQDNATTPLHGNLLVHACQVADGDLLSDSVQIIYTLIRQPDGFLRWTTYYEVTTTTTSRVLSEDIYAKVRQQIIDKLHDRPTYYVAPVPP